MVLNGEINDKGIAELCPVEHYEAYEDDPTEKTRTYKFLMTRGFKPEDYKLIHDYEEVE